MSETLRFCADVHLGKLARLLRMLGFDTVYKNDFSKKDLCEIALKEQRILVSKSDYFSRLPGITFYQIKSADPFEQLKDVIQHFNLHGLFEPFSRCLNCNEILQKIKKEEVENRLLRNTKKDFSEFWQCPSCTQIYWKGSHYERMMKMIEQLETGL